MNIEVSFPNTALLLSSSPKPPPQSVIKWYPYTLMLISTLILSFATFYGKYIIQSTSSTYYNVFTFLFFRSLAIVLCSFISFSIQKDSILKPLDIPHKKWFILRVSLRFCSLIFFFSSLCNLRCSTAQVILSITQITSLFLLTVVFNERLSHSLIIELIICCIGVILVILNEFNNKDSSSYSIIKGVCYALASLTISCINFLSNKKVSLNQISYNNHSFYAGLATTIYSGVYCLITFQFNYSVGYIIMSFMHGVFFVLGHSLSFYATNIDQKIKVHRLTHFQIVYVFLLAYVLLGEEVYFTDWVGVMFIISVMMYHSYYSN